MERIDVLVSNDFLKSKGAVTGLPLREVAFENK